MHWKHVLKTGLNRSVGAIRPRNRRGHRSGMIAETVWFDLSNNDVWLKYSSSALIITVSLRTLKLLCAPSETMFRMKHILRGGGMSLIELRICGIGFQSVSNNFSLKL